MEAFVVKILASLLIIVLITSNVVAEKLSMENKTGKNGRTLGIKNSTKKDSKHQATVYRGVQNVFNDPGVGCYTQFFVGDKPPTGLRDPNNPYDPNNVKIKYICQPNNQQTFYGTMFDPDQGIAVFAAYRLGPGDVTFQSKFKRVSWKRTPGILRNKQGNHNIYGKKKGLNPYQFQKGHLVSHKTFSSTPERCKSTYTYTNAVPQAPAFNNDGWKEYEIRIRRYAKKNCITQQQQQQQQQLQQGQQGQPTLYLLTGTSSVGIQQQQNPPQPILNLPVMKIGDSKFGLISVPNSMWTAGCCVRPNGQKTESFAVIGNNVQNKQGTFTQQVTVAQLQTILQADVNKQKNVNVDLFPGNKDCVNNDFGKLPERVF